MTAIDKRDGKWHTVDPFQTTTKLQVWSHQGGRSVNQTRRIWRGRITRFVDGNWENDQCPSFHYHQTRKGAAGCADRAARRLNRRGA